MSTIPDAISAAKFTRFPREVQDAYSSFCRTGDMTAVDVVIIAALKEFMPRKPTQEITDQFRLIEDLGYDSLAVAELVFFLEDCFQVRIETQGLVSLRTVGDLRAFVVSKLGSQKTSM